MASSRYMISFKNLKKLVSKVHVCPMDAKNHEQSSHGSPISFNVIQ